MTHPDARRIEITENLRDVRARIARACQAAGRPAEDVTLIAATKFFPVTDPLRLAERVAGLAGLRLSGVMAVAPLGADPEPAFGRLAAAAEALRAEHPQASVISAGMSADLEPAIRHGSTHVRVGTALLGPR